MKHTHSAAELAADGVPEGRRAPVAGVEETLRSEPAESTAARTSAGSLDTIGFDADDTVWHNIGLFEETQARLCELLSGFSDRAEVERTLYRIEMRNLDHFGYGIKSFVLSMVQTAIEISGAAIETREIGRIIEWGREMLATPAQLIDGVEEVLDRLQGRYELVLLTKGDSFDQRIKIRGSGLESYFDHIEILSSKRPDDYRAFLEGRGTPAERFLMVGNSVRSDILPVRAIGGHAVHVPYPLTWLHEHVSESECGDTECFRISSIRELPSLLEAIERHDSIPRPSDIQEHALAVLAAAGASGWPRGMSES